MSYLIRIRCDLLRIGFGEADHDRCVLEFDMTRKRDRKSLIRARMKKTGERYMAAKRNLERGGGADELVPPPVVLSEPESVAATEAVTWHPLIETSADEAQALLDVALSREPRLTHFGIGISDEILKRARAAHSGQVLEDIKREFAEERDSLSKQLDEIAACADWIKRQRRTASYNMRRTSYGYKHLVERWFDDRGGPHLYIANGSFIAAALGLGFDGEPDEWGSPNLLFKFSERTVTKMRKLG